MRKHSVSARGILGDREKAKTMRSRTFIFALIALTAAAALAGHGTAGAADRGVVITGAGFVPADVTVAVGDSVTWKNSDAAAHQVEVAKTTCKVTIQPGASASCTFRAGGKFSYRDPTHKGAAFRGTITVTGARASVTLASGRTTSVYQAPLTLSGVVSNQQASQTVTVQSQDCGKTTLTRVGTATTTAGGQWTFTVRPTINTVYQASWRTTDSAKLAVKVSPKLRLTRSGRRFTARATAAQALTGKTVVFQRYRAATRRWITVKRVRLGTATTPTAGTFVTSTRFRSAVRRGSRVRVLLPQAQAGACYAAATSNTLRIR
jgi:plastocyanin